MHVCNSFQDQVISELEAKLTKAKSELKVLAYVCTVRTYDQNSSYYSTQCSTYISIVPVSIID